MVLFQNPPEQAFKLFLFFVIHFDILVSTIDTRIIFNIHTIILTWLTNIYRVSQFICVHVVMVLLATNLIVHIVEVAIVCFATLLITILYFIYYFP